MVQITEQNKDHVEPRPSWFLEEMVLQILEEIE